jgi:septum formation protein
VGRLKLAAVRALFCATAMLPGCVSSSFSNRIMFPAASTIAIAIFQLFFSASASAAAIICFAASRVMNLVVPSIMVEMVQPLVLASQSPRRKELLEILGIPFSIVVPAIDETPRAGDRPQDYVLRVAKAKALDVASRVSESVVLSADTVVTIGDEILGKPRDRADAIRMLTKLSGREHRVFTGVSLLDQGEGALRSGVEQTSVFFRKLSSDEIENYLDREDVMDKAGAYAIQGFASVFIPKISGSYSNVMGLPLALVYELLRRPT